MSGEATERAALRTGPGLLRKGTTKCPKDKTPLHFRQFAGMRIYHVEGGGKGGLGGMSYYEAVCPKCNWWGHVRRGKYTEDDL